MVASLSSQLITHWASLCAALAGIALVAKWLLDSALAKQNLERAKLDAAVEKSITIVATNLANVQTALNNETHERHQWEADLERRKAHTKANHDAEIKALAAKHAASDASLQDVVRRVIVLEEGQKAILTALVDIRDAVKQSTETSAHQFDQVCQSIREISKRSAS